MNVCRMCYKAHFPAQTRNIYVIIDVYGKTSQDNRKGSNMTVDFRVYYYTPENKKRVERWAKANNLKTSAAINKLIMDTVTNWEKENSIDND